MAGRSFDPATSGYVEVATRITDWYTAHPQGRIETVIVESSDEHVTVRATVYRDSNMDSPPAGTGHSGMDIPGSTPYTRGSELENAETSAVGRALVMAGIPSKTVASADEVAAKKGGDAESTEPEVIGPYEHTGAIAVRAHPPADGNLRRGSKTGEAFLIFAFDAGNGKMVPQVVAQGSLAEDIFDAVGQNPSRLHGAVATVSGTLSAIPWKKNGRTMRPYQQLALARLVVEGPDGFVLPTAVPVAEGQESLEALL